MYQERMYAIIVRLCVMRRYDVYLAFVGKERRLAFDGFHKYIRFGKCCTPTTLGYLTIHDLKRDVIEKYVVIKA